MKESCGIFGISHSADAAQDIFYGLLALQHRGQESAGISTFSDIIKSHRGMGLVSDVFKTEKILELKGTVGIGHVRYSTSGSSIIENAQPMEFESEKYKISIGFNGNVPNYPLVTNALLNGIELKTACDAEGMGIIFLNALDRTDDIFAAGKELLTRIPAAYSIIMLIHDRKNSKSYVVGIRDRYGLRPMCIGERNGTYVMASESVALDAVGATYLGEVRPGSVEVISGTDRMSKQLIEAKKAHCMFEYVYFSRPDSIVDGKSIYEIRIKLGENLVKSFNKTAELVIPVPDTSRPATEGISRKTGIPSAEGLIKNRYVGRTFIMPEQSAREHAVKTKMNPVKSVLKDKNIILVDDSIVRGTTSKKIVKLLKDAGTKNIDVWVTCPPIISPCFYGVDMKSHSELIAANNAVSEIKDIIGSDELNYQTVEGLKGAIGHENLCMGCLTGIYPTDDAQQLADKMKEQTGLMRKKFFEKP